MDKKYILLKDKSIEYKNNVLYRIQAVKDFENVKSGDLGGYVQSEKNLSQEGSCWVYDNAKVYNNAKVFENARILNNAEIFQDAVIYGNVNVSWNALIYGNAKIFDNVTIKDNAEIFDNVILTDNVIVMNNAKIYGNAEVSNNVKVCDQAIICNKAKVFGDITIGAYAIIAHGKVNFNIRENLTKYIAASLNILSDENNNYIVYKKVNKIGEGKYASLYNPDFIYKLGEEVEIYDYDVRWEKFKTTGLYVSTPHYYEIGDTLLECQVNLKDIITCQGGVLRVRKLKVLREINL